MKYFLIFLFESFQFLNSSTPLIKKNKLYILKLKQKIFNFKILVTEKSERIDITYVMSFVLNFHLKTPRLNEFQNYTFNT